MARRAKGPRRRKADGKFYTTVNGEKVYLADTEAEAWPEFHEVHSKKDEPGLRDEAAAICEQYLEHARTKKTDKSYKLERFFPSSFCCHAGGIRVGNLKKNDVTKWLGCQDTWTPTTRADAGGAVKRPSAGRPARVRARILVGAASRAAPSAPCRS